MTSGYPGALDTTARFPATVEDDTDSKSGTDLGTSSTVGFLAQWMRDMGDAMIKVQTELGINPSGTFTDVLARLAARSTVRKSADENFTTQVLANVADLSFAVAANQDYEFEFVLAYQAGTARGIGLAVTTPGAINYLACDITIGGIAGDGTGGALHGSCSASADTVASATAAAAATNYIAVLKGILSVGGTAGTLQVQARQGTGATAANAIVKKGSYGEMYLN